MVSFESTGALGIVLGTISPTLTLTLTRTLVLERQVGWSRSKVTHSEGTALELGILVDDVLTHANGTPIGHLGPLQIQQILG